VDARPPGPDLRGYIRGLLLAGMDIARINGAHGTAADWKRLVEAIRKAEKSLAAEGTPPKRRCHIEVDLSGPRIRIGAVAGKVRLGAGDRFRLARVPGATALPAKGDEPPLFTCTLPEALTHVRAGESVFIDDGKFAAKVECETPEWIEARVISPGDKKRKVKPEKGLNFPETAIELPALTKQDRADLPAVAAIADIVGLSFVHRGSDVPSARCAGVSSGRMGLASSQIEKRVRRGTRELLAEGLKLPAFGVMIARGDLAVEVGFDELASYQENILCMCEAAHVPAVWATQVLETLAQAGLPARAEITDAAEATRADCVMLNKGPHVAEATALLDRLLTSEHRHREKKRELFREFMAQEGFSAGNGQAAG